MAPCCIPVSFSPYFFSPSQCDWEWAGQWNISQFLPSEDWVQSFSDGFITLFSGWGRAWRERGMRRWRRGGHGCPVRAVTDGEWKQECRLYPSLVSVWAVSSSGCGFRLNTPKIKRRIYEEERWFQTSLRRMVNKSSVINKIHVWQIKTGNQSDVLLEFFRCKKDRNLTNLNKICKSQVKHTYTCRI